MDMKIFRPVKSNILYQGFGANTACARMNADGTIAKPYDIISKVGTTCPIGYGDFYKLLGYKGHNGEDWGAYHGEAVHFNVALPGVPNMRWWARTEVDDAKGINLYVFSLDPIYWEELPPETSDHARQVWLDQGKFIHICFLYVHGNQVFLEDKPKVQVGVFGDGSPQMMPEIKIGDKIMAADNTGASAGDHLHFSMKFRAKNSMVVGGDNGYAGAIPTSPYFENRFILDVLGESQPKPRYTFTRNLEWGEETPEALKLQEILKYEKCMPEWVIPAPFYGNQTKAAVAAFQKKYKIFSIAPGRYFYEKTRAKMNSIYGISG